MSRPLTPSTPSRWRLGLLLWLLGMPGVVAVVASLVPTLRANAGLLPAPVEWVIALSGLQTAGLLALAVAAGVACAPRVGLHAPWVEAWCGWPAAASSPARERRGALTWGMGAGALGALWLVLLAAWAPESLRAQGAPVVASWPVRLLYGGVTEELLMRWGVMSFLVWFFWKLLPRREPQPSAGVLWAGVLVSAALFAVGHLPAAQAMAGGLTAPVVVFVLVGNSVWGVVAGLLYARKGLEAAMLAHLIAHLGTAPFF